MNQITLDLSGLDQAIQSAVSTAISKAMAKVSTPEPVEQSDRLNVDQACQLLNRTRSWLFKKTMLKEVPFSKFGSRLVFSKKELEFWMESQTIPAENPGEVMSDRLAETAKRRDK
jgi:predicted DNA-binding transcriptional regulator AlpA